MRGRLLILLPVILLTACVGRERLSAVPEVVDECGVTMCLVAEGGSQWAMNPVPMFRTISSPWSYSLFPFQVRYPFSLNQLIALPIVISMGVWGKPNSFTALEQS